MMYAIIFLVIVINTVIFGYCLSEFFKKRFREKLEKELQGILYHAEKLDEQLKAAIGDIPQFSKELSDEITPFVKLYVAEAIDKYVADENEKLRALLVPAEVQYSDAELLPNEDALQKYGSFQEIEDAVQAAFDEGNIEEVREMSNDKVADYSDKFLKRPGICLNNVGVKRISIPPELWHTIHSLAYANASGSQNIEPLSISAVTFNIINDHFNSHSEEINILAERGTEKILRGYDRY
ncbi:hypothetical protein [uncultured Duncaniella sp.]|uniref:hypothetical protein n=1 Tax=uncultured Duncaniella sp. TaxID=2768039 RepID=UPI0025A9D46B|nr:hypothetical protein [uncultured Duncaniella sp.]